MLNDKDDGTTGRQDDEKSSPAAFGTRGTNSRQPVVLSSCSARRGTCAGCCPHAKLAKSAKAGTRNSFADLADLA